MEAQFVHGDPLMLDYTPSGADVACGEVVVVGDLPRVAHSDIEDGVLGSLAARGGVYKMAKASGVGTAIAAGKRVCWKASDSTITETQGANKIFGFSAAAAGDDDEEILVEHDPYTDLDVS